MTHKTVVVLLVVVLILFLLMWIFKQQTSLSFDPKRQYMTLSQRLATPTTVPLYQVEELAKKQDPFLDASLIPLVGQAGVGTVAVVDKRNFPVVQGMTSYLVEIWENHMRIPHWHNESEVGLLLEGILQIYIASPFPSRLTGSKGQPIGETEDQTPHMEIVTIKTGQAWYIPSGRIHSLHNVSEIRATMIIGFSSNAVSDADLPVAFGAVPALIKKEYVGSPHDALITYKGTTTNPLFAWNPVPYEVPESPQGHLFRFDLMQNPLSNIPERGMFNWAVDTNWPILRDMAVGLTILKPQNQTDAMWYPTTDCLFVLGKGKAEFSILSQPTQLEPKVHYRQTRILFPGDMVFVPRSMMHVFRCISKDDVHMVSFYNRPDPKRPVSLSSFALYTYPFRQASLNQYGSKRDESPIFVDAEPAKQLLAHPFPVLTA
jgi:oxalate decarboxylase